jgi:hypothetical protein
VIEGSVGPSTVVVVVVNAKYSASAGSQTVTVQSTVHHFTEQRITYCTLSHINIQLDIFTMETTIK